MTIREEFKVKANQLSYKVAMQSLGSFDFDELLIMAIDEIYRDNAKLKAEIQRLTEIQQLTGQE